MHKREVQREGGDGGLNEWLETDFDLSTAVTCLRVFGFDF